jgi:hypothetical protein
MKCLRINFLVGTTALAELVFIMVTGLTRNKWGAASLSILLFISAALFLSPKGKKYPANEINYKNKLSLNQIQEGAHEKPPSD